MAQGNAPACLLLCILPAFKLAESVGQVLGSRVVDETKVAGTFTFTLEFDPESGRPAPASDAAPETPLRLSLFTVLQKQLGLKLEGRKEPLEVVVVDKAEKPTGN
jgi:uncharacterized protein (TIGR03435 family)